MPLHRFDRAHLHAAPWKNGGGVTREIVSTPRGAGLDSFTWRASIADVSADGPFSIFAGVDRGIVLLDGNGVVLREPEGRIVHRLVEPFVPFVFSGDEQLAASLVGGPSSDFNVMTRRSAASADVDVIRRSASFGGPDSASAPTSVAAARAGVLFAARGQWTVQSADDGADDAAGTAMSFDAGDGCWWDDELLGWRVAAGSADAVLVAVRVENPPRRF